MKFFEGKQGKDLLIIGALALLAYKFMGVFNGGLSKPIQKVTV